MHLTLRAVALTCGCGTTYRDALLVGGYGRLLVHDRAGRHPRVADLLADPLVDRLGQAVEGRRALFARVGSAPPDVPAAYLRLCDASPDGLPYDRGALPACPACGAQPAGPERLEELVPSEVEPLTHDAFDALPREQQAARIDAALSPAAAPPSA